VCIADNYAYVSCYYRGLHIVDVSDPTNPVPVANPEFIPWAEEVVILGQYAYVAAHHDGLLIISIADPTNPTLIGQVFTGIANAVYISDGYAYLGCSYPDLSVIDITDPRHPREVASIHMPGIGNSCWKVGPILYLALNDGRVVAFDVTDPSDPIPIDQYITPNGTQDIHVDGDHLYVADLSSVMILSHPSPTIGKALVEPDVIQSLSAHSLDPEPVTIYAGAFAGGYAATDIDLQSLSVNGFTRVHAEILPSHPEFAKAVLAVELTAPELINTYQGWYCESQQEVNVHGSFNDGQFFTASGWFTAQGRGCGDPDADGLINVSDLVSLLNHVFAGSPLLAPQEISDLDCSGIVNVSDAVYLLSYIFDGGREPCAECP
jgi:hypothetical protein